MRILKNSCMVLIILAAHIFFHVPVLAATETYTQAKAQAVSNAANPANWLATSGIISVNGTDTHDLRYDASKNLIVRTAAAAWKFSSNYVGQANYYTFQDSDPKKVDTNASWITTGNDLTNFYNTKGGGATGLDFVKVLERGLGMDTAGNHDVIVEYSLAANNNMMMRPVKDPDITDYHSAQYGSSDASFPFIRPPDMTDDNAWTKFKAYYNYWKTTSASTFPWTQLGYSYFWGNGDSPPAGVFQIQGMTEFILLEHTLVNIYGIYATQSYIYTKNNGQYGNGYANFNIDGACDSVWAGHRFQNGVSRLASLPNEINVTGSAGSVFGGQGILVWSLNYAVTVGSGCTVTSDGVTDKYGIAGTKNIAILFDGDTTTNYGTPITGGINKVTNSGTITGNGSNTGTAIKILNGDTTIVNNSGGTIAGTTAIDCSASIGTMSITNRGTITGGITLAAATATTLDIGNTALTLTNGHLSALTLIANSSTDFGNITTTGTSVDASSTINVTTGGYIPNSTTFQVINTVAGISAVPSTITPSSPIFTFSGDNSTNNLILTATRAKSYNSFASNSNVANAGSILNTMAMNNTATGDMVNILGALDSLTSASAINQALENMLPNADNSATQTSQATLDQYLSTVFAHLDAFKNVTSGALIGPDVWASGFGSYIHQDPMDASNGYNATIWGTALGCDVLTLDHLRLGLSGGFAQDFVRTKDSSARTDIDSYQGTLYGSYTKDAYYVDAAFSFAYNTYDTNRNVTVGALDRTAAGDYNGQQYSAYIGGGYKFIGKNVEMTPLASFQYMHLRLNNYTESGAGAANLKVDPQDYDVAQTGLGMKFGYPVDLKGGIGRLTPELKFKWLYDWIGDAQQATSTFTGGGGSFGTKGFTPAQSSYDFGAKLTLETVNFVTLSLSYDLELKEDFYGHYGLAEVRYRF
ncbi:MAG: autotransporter domain-containing protein [Candidatus Omnitrophica bacterium]|nr:autotransporter domain-containing protein [Candidatus Omnitrophota bacterium]